MIPFPFQQAQAGRIFTPGNIDPDAASLYPKISRYWSFDTNGTENKYSQSADALGLSVQSGKISNACSAGTVRSSGIGATDPPVFSSGSSKWTLGAWVNLASVATTRNIFALSRASGSSGESANIAYISGLGFQASCRNSALTDFFIRNGSNQSASTWYWVLAMFTGGVVQLWQDNTLIGSSSAFTGSAPSFSEWWIGAPFAGTSSDALLDEVFWANDELTSSERSYLYNSGSGRSFNTIKSEAGY